MQSQDWIVLLHTLDQLLFDTNTQIVYHLLTRLYQKHTQFQDWIVLLVCQ
jgi:hypothetical protein